MRSMSIIRGAVLGRLLSDHVSLGVGVSYDYDDAISDVFTIDPDKNNVRATKVDALTPPDWATTGNGWGAGAGNGYAPITRYEFVLQLLKEHHAVRLVVWDETNPQSGTGESFALSAILLEVKPGAEEIDQTHPDLMY